MRTTSIILILALLAMNAPTFGGPQAGSAFSEKKAGAADKPVAMAGKAYDEDGRKGTFPWLLVGGAIVAGAVVGALVAWLVVGKKSDPAPGQISITSTPAGAKVYLDGADTGRVTDCVLTGIKAGDHALRIELPGYGKWEGTVTVPAGQTVYAVATLAAFKYEFVTKWGSAGTGDGQFGWAYGIAADASGNIYVADSGNHRIQKFSSTGAFMGRWGTWGTGDATFKDPEGVATDSTYFYATDGNNHRVQKFASGGQFLAKWGVFGSGNGQMNWPRGIAVDGSGYIYITESNGHRIQKFTTSGGFVAKWGSQGSGDGQFDHPYGIAVDKAGGNVYVVDGYSNNRIEKFDSNGVFIRKWGSAGSGDGQFSGPMGIAVDSYGYVYVADYHNSRIQKFTPDGEFVTKWGSRGSGDGQFNGPSAVAVDGTGFVYVMDLNNYRVQKFQLTSQTTLSVEISYAPPSAAARDPSRYGRPAREALPRR